MYSIAIIVLVAVTTANSQSGTLQFPNCGCQQAGVRLFPNIICRRADVRFPILGTIGPTGGPQGGTCVWDGFAESGQTGNSNLGFDGVGGSGQGLSGLVLIGGSGFGSWNGPVGEGSGAGNGNPGEWFPATIRMVPNPNFQQSGATQVPGAPGGLQWAGRFKLTPADPPQNAPVPDPTANTGNPSPQGNGCRPTWILPLQTICQRPAADPAVNDQAPTEQANNQGSASDPPSANGRRKRFMRKGRQAGSECKFSQQACSQRSMSFEPCSNSKEGPSRFCR